jgi:hypothetical protein
MSEFITHKRPEVQSVDIGGVPWFTLMVGMWSAFFTLLLAAPDTLQEIWDWLTGLSLVAEVVMWILILPWALALAVWQSSWGDWQRLLVMALLGAAWTGISVPRAKHSH